MRLLFFLFIVFTLCSVSEMHAQFRHSRTGFSMYDPGNGYSKKNMELSHRASGNIMHDTASGLGKKAFLISLLIPGFGDLHIHNWDLKKWGNGKYFFGSEVTLWSSFFYLRSYSGWLKQDSRAFSAMHAGVKWNSVKPTKFNTVIGKFRDIYSYNETQRRLTGSSLLYSENEANYWKWDSQSNMKKYDRMRIRSQSAGTYATYVAYGIVVNHLLSAINTIRTLKLRSRQQNVSFHLTYVNSFSAYDRYHGVVLHVSGR